MITDRHTGEILAAALFLQRRDPAVRDWPTIRLLDWLSHFWRRSQVGVVMHGHEVAAVGVARCVASVEEALTDPYAHHESPDIGCILWCDQIASVHRLGLPILLSQARDRFGPRSTVRGLVANRRTEQRLLPWSRVELILKYNGLL